MRPNLYELAKLIATATPLPWRWEDEFLVGPPGSVSNPDPGEERESEIILEDGLFPNPTRTADRELILRAMNALPRMLELATLATWALLDSASVEAGCGCDTCRTFRESRSLLLEATAWDERQARMVEAPREALRDVRCDLQALRVQIEASLRTLRSSERRIEDCLVPDKDVSDAAPQA